MRFCTFILSFLLITANVGLAASYNYISAEEMKEKFTAGEDIIIVDIQVKEEYEQHHLPGSVATYAYPVKSETERAAIDIAVAKYNETGEPVVIVCPRGKGGAKRTYDYMISQNVLEDKLTILENGMSGWPYQDLLERK